MSKQVTDYKRLDAAIVAHIEKNGGSQFAELLRDLGSLAGSIGPKCRFGYPDGFRAIDRRLQALRKQGRITPSRKTGKWSIKEGVAAI